MTMLHHEERRPERKNIFYLDVIRIVAVYLVLLLHAISPFITRLDLYDTLTWNVALGISPLVRMGVPLFFMMSGYLILSDPRTSDFATFYKRRLPRILIPFLVWNMIYYLVYHIVRGATGSVSEFLMGMFNQDIMYHFWYIYTLCGMYVLAPFFKRIVDNCTKRQVLLLLLVVLFPTTFIPFVCIFTKLNIYGFPTMLNGYFGFFIFGYLLGKWPPERKWRIVMYGLGIAAWFGGALGNYLTSSAEQMPLQFNYGHNLVHFMTAGAFFVLMQALSDKLEKILPAKTIKYWASLTFGIYLCHVMCMDMWNHFVVTFATPAYCIVNSFAGSVIVSTLAVLCISRIKPIKKLLM